MMLKVTYISLFFDNPDDFAVVTIVLRQIGGFVDVESNHHTFE